MYNYLGYGRQEGRYPDADDELDSPGGLGDGVGKEGVADGYVAFDCEGSDGEYCSVGGRFRDQALQEATDLSEDVRVPATTTQYIVVQQLIYIATRYIATPLDIDIVTTDIVTYSSK